MNRVEIFVQVIFLPETEENALLTLTGIFTTIYHAWFFLWYAVVYTVLYLVHVVYCGNQHWTPAGHAEG